MSGLELKEASFIVVKIFKLKKALNSLMKKICKPDDDLTGRWSTYFVKSGKLQKEHLELVQFCHEVSGFINYPDNKKLYYFKGNIRSKVISAIYYQASKTHSRDRGSFTLIGCDREKQEILKGFYSWMDNEDQRIKADDYVWIKDGSKSLDDRVETNNSSISGSGAFAAKPLYKSEIIHYFEGDQADKKTDYSLTFDEKYIEPTNILRNLNHSCSPNCDFDGQWLFAKESIKKGVELTIDYILLEGKLTKGFSCACGSPQCRVEIN